MSAAHISRNCQQCGRSFMAWRSEIKKGPRRGCFCSISCSNAAHTTRLNKVPLAERKKPRACHVCKKIFIPNITATLGIYCSSLCRQGGIARSTAEKRGDLQRHRGAGKSYIKRMGSHEHRQVAERKIGRPLKKGEIVHHINGDHRDNRPENLQVMTQAEHMNEHRRELLEGRRIFR